jgi:hypothetical protein
VQADKYRMLALFIDAPAGKKFEKFLLNLIHR